jgi:SAM-dependent methyltransferase
MLVPVSRQHSPHRAMSTTEQTPFGYAKRLDYASRHIATRQVRSVLDIGCGTGDRLTAPLAARFPGVHFTGVDSDRNSIRYASTTNRLPNLRFGLDSELMPSEPFDMIIASEVLEHVHDPRSFLCRLRSQLTEDGFLLLTVPNGYGPFEAASAAEGLLLAMGGETLMSAIHRFLRWLKRRIIGRGAPAARVVHDTLATSPHINFFRLRDLRTIAASAGFRVVTCQPRTLLCGFAIGRLVRSPAAQRWNASVVDQLPYWMASGWMLVLEQAPTGWNGRAWRPGFVSRLRRSLNARRWYRGQRMVGGRS